LSLAVATRGYPELKRLESLAADQRFANETATADGNKRLRMFAKYLIYHDHDGR